MSPKPINPKPCTYRDFNLLRIGPPEPPSRVSRNRSGHPQWEEPNALALSCQGPYPRFRVQGFNVLKWLLAIDVVLLFIGAVSISEPTYAKVEQCFFFCRIPGGSGGPFVSRLVTPIT